MSVWRLPRGSGLIQCNYSTGKMDVQVNKNSSGFPVLVDIDEKRRLFTEILRTGMEKEGKYVL